MEDEIGSAAELFEAAELRDVVMHQLVANRETGPDADALGLPPEALHAPGSPDESVAMELRTHVGGLELGVRVAVTTRNAYAAFHVDAEAVFALPAPIASGRQDIVQEFIERVGGPAVFPYIRAAVASLAAQLLVPASPLPLLHSVDMELAPDDLAPDPDDDDPLPQHPDDDPSRYVLGEPSLEMLLGLLADVEVHCCREVVQAHQAGSDFLLFGHTKVWECPKEVTYKPGGPYSVVVTDGDPHLEIVADNDTSAARLEARWGDVHITRHDPIFDLYLNIYIPERTPDTGPNYDQLY